MQHQAGAARAHTRLRSLITLAMQDRRRLAHEDARRELARMLSGCSRASAPRAKLSLSCLPLCYAAARAAIEVGESDGGAWAFSNERDEATGVGAGDAAHQATLRQAGAGAALLPVDCSCCVRAQRLPQRLRPLLLLSLGCALRP